LKVEGVHDFLIDNRKRAKENENHACEEFRCASRAMRA
jgi:hypothetical protein